MSREKTPFKPARYKAIVKKEIIQIKKDPANLAVALLLPVMLLFLLGNAISSEIENIDMTVWDQNQSNESRELIQNFENSKLFSYTSAVQSYEEVEKELNKGNVNMALIIPGDFSEKIGNSTASVGLFINGSDPAVAKTALSNAKWILQNKSISIQMEQLNQLGVGKIQQPLDIRTNILYNPNMDAMQFNIPALVGLIMQEVILILTAFTLVREKEKGTMEQLIVTPIKSSELILGKLTPYIFIGLFSFLFVLVVSIWWYGVTINGSILLLIVLSLLFLITTLAMGIFISILAKNQLQAMYLAFAVILPSVILSGFVFPREPMPFVIQLLGGFIPLTYYLEILRGIFLKGIGIQDLWMQTIALGSFTLIFCVASIFKFKKNLE